MAELNYWQAIGLDPLWIRRHAEIAKPLEIAVTESSEVFAAINTQIESSNENESKLNDTIVPLQTMSTLPNDILDLKHNILSLTPPKNTDTLNINDHQQLTQIITPVAEALPIDIANLDWPELISHIQACRACSLGCSRTNAVPGVGVKNSPLMIIGEAPGADEDRLGEPFVGQAGKLLDLMLVSLGLSRKENVYIANILKCRPPNNRRPEVTEVQACIAYLYRQLALVQPRVLLVLGATAAHALLDTDEPIGKLRGRVHQYQGLPMIVTYHPAYLLRSPAEKSKTWADLCLLANVMQESLAKNS